MMPIAIRKTVTMLIAGILITGGGTLFGYLAGSRLLSMVLFRYNRLALLLSNPAKEYYFVMENLNNPDEIKRLTGYYALFTYKKIDLEFLKYRYEHERSPGIRRTIIWMLGRFIDRREIRDYLNSICKTAAPAIQYEILHASFRYDPRWYQQLKKDLKLKDDNVVIDSIPFPL